MMYHETMEATPLHIITHQTFEVEEVTVKPPPMATSWWVFSELWTEIGTICNRHLKTSKQEKKKRIYLLPRKFHFLFPSKGNIKICQQLLPSLSGRLGELSGLLEVQTHKMNKANMQLCFLPEHLHVSVRAAWR